MHQCETSYARNPASASPTFGDDLATDGGIANDQQTLWRAPAESWSVPKRKGKSNTGNIAGQETPLEPHADVVIHIAFPTRT
jgi:hypothetical protein